MSDRIFIDSNIFLYAFSLNDEYKQKISKEIILESAIISTQVINEVSINMLKKFKFTESQVADFIKSAFSRYEIISLNQEIFITASNLRQNHLFSYYDSIILSAALFAQCDTIYTEDMQENRIVNGELKIINPFLVTP